MKRKIKKKKQRVKKEDFVGFGNYEQFMKFDDVKKHYNDFRYGEKLETDKKMKKKPKRFDAWTNWKKFFGK